jgi:hypothetical protein
MKSWLMIGVLGLAGSLMARAQDEFSQRMTPAEFEAAGLAKLTPAERARLDELVKKYSVPGAESAAAAQARRAEIEAAVAQQSAARVAEADARAAKAEAEAEERTKKAEQEAAASREAAKVAKEEQKKTEDGFLTKAKKVFVSAGTKVEVAAIESEIDGRFDGWDSVTSWTLKDGTVWRVDNRPAPHSMHSVQNPRVRVYPAAISGYWMEFVDLDVKVRVRQLVLK